MCRYRLNLYEYINHTKFKENIDSFAYQKALDMLRKLIDREDSYILQHSMLVSGYAYLIGHELGFQGRELTDLILSALLHDVGKTSVPTRIILKKRSLRPGEFQKIKKHVFYGAEIVSRDHDFAGLAMNILCHHERWDGLGYPFGLNGKEIPLYARIIGLVDSFDAMTADRAYRNHLSFAEALQELETNANQQFDAYLVQTFKKLIIGKGLEEMENNLCKYM